MAKVTKRPFASWQDSPKKKDDGEWRREEGRGRHGKVREGSDRAVGLESEGRNGLDHGRREESGLPTLGP